jgi:hypothetical protein
MTVLLAPSAGTTEDTLGLAEQAQAQCRCTPETAQRLAFTRWRYQNGNLTEWELAYQYNRKTLQRLAFMRWLHQQGRLNDGQNA